MLLDVLTESESGDLLRGHLGAERVADEPDAVAALVDHCAGLPLALGIVAARATLHPELPLAALAEELRSASTRLDALDAGELSVNLRAALSCSHAALSTEAAEAFALLGAAPGPDISLAAAASLLGAPLPRTRALLTELMHSHLLQEAVPGRHRMHDLVRLFAAELARRAGDRHREALNRVIDHYLQTAWVADTALNPGRGPLPLTPPRPGVVSERVDAHPSALAWFNAEQQVLVSAVDLAASMGFDRHACELATALQTFLSRRPDWPELLATQRIAVAAAKRLDDPLALTHAHRGVGIAYIGLRRFDEAYLELSHALELAGGVDDPESAAQVHRSLARLFAQQGRFAEALPHDERALELYRAAGDQLGQATSLNAIGWHLAHLGQPEQAMTRCRQGLALYERLGDVFGQAITWDSLGYVHHQLGGLEDSVGCYQRAVKLLRDLGHSGTAGTSLVDLGEVYQAAGERAAAREAWREALQIFEEFSDPGADGVRERLALDQP
jgi:tetratricopeptide (TPR) repeat protein